MSLLVLDPDIVLARYVAMQLSDLGFNTSPIDDAPRVDTLCAQQQFDVLVLCSSTLLPSFKAPPGIILVLAVTDSQGVEQALNWLPDGVMDIWQLPQSYTQLQDRIRRTQDNHQRTVSQVGAELQSMQLELEKDQRAGQYIQMGMLPPNPMGIGHFRLQHRVEPSLILSGDFVDYFQITDRYFACYVADVAGHGASSAFVTVLLKNFFTPPAT